MKIMLNHIGIFKHVNLKKIIKLYQKLISNYKISCGNMVQKMVFFSKLELKLHCPEHI